MSTIEQSGEEVVFNMNEIAEAKFESLPEGEYDGIIRSCEYKESKSSGQPMWAIQIIVQGGEYEGRTLFANMSFSTKAAPITKKHLMAISPELAEKADLKLVADAPELINLPVRVKVVPDTYQGTPQNKIKNFLPVT